MKSSLIEKCKIGSFLLNKNYFIFYEAETLDSDQISKLAKYKI